MHPFYLFCYCLFHAPLVQSTRLVGWLDEFEFHACGLHSIEAYGTCDTLIGWIAWWVLHFYPIAWSILVVEFPRVWYLTSLPRLVVVPVDCRSGNFCYLLKLISKPLCRVGLWPPMSIRDTAVVSVSRNQPVVDSAQRRQVTLWSSYLWLWCNRWWQSRFRCTEVDWRRGSRTYRYKPEHNR